MKRFITLAMLAVAMSVHGVAQTSMTPQMQNAPARKSPLAGYAGAWIGVFEGHTWMSDTFEHAGRPAYRHGSAGT